MADNSAAGAQPGPLPIIHRVTPINPPGHRRFLEGRWLVWDEDHPARRVQWLTADGQPHPPDRAIYHSTVAPSSTDSSAEWLSTHPTSGVSINTLANRDGSLTEIVPPMWEAYHAGYALPDWGNVRALGLEFENASGNARGDVEPYPDVQINAGAYRVATWGYSFGFGLDMVQPHRLVAVFGPTSPKRGQLGRKSDPVGPFPDDRFRAFVQAWRVFFDTLPAASISHYVQGAPEQPAAPVEYPFLSAPTISLAVFTRVLTDRHSPILQEGYSADLYYNLCIEQGINPAIALAFTLHENGAGTTGVTAPLKNWGAVRSAERPALAAQDSPVQTPLGPFAKYNYWLDSLRDWCLRIKGPKYLGSRPGMTVREALHIYAPTSDPAGKNNPDSYADVVRDMVAAWKAESKL